MIKKNEAAPAQEIEVIIARLGSESKRVRLPNDETATVQAALEKAGVNVPSGAELTVSGEDASYDDVLEDGDVLTISTNKQAGS